MTAARAGRGARLVLASTLLVASATVGLTASAAAGAGASSPFSATKRVTRTYLDASGTSHTLLSKTVNVKVDQTKSLRGREDVNVSWSGAQPTGGVESDLNGVLADQQEYPMMLVECRGTAVTASPETCWTHGADARYQGVSYTSYAPWRLDRYASVPDRAAVVGRPSGVDAECGTATSNERWLPFHALDGSTYDYGNQSCAGLPPEDFNFDSSAQVVPQNTTFAPTAKDGTGSTKFDIWTDAENASLGCNTSVACTLEVVPIMGISCDPYGKAAGVPASDVPPSNGAGTDSPASAAAQCQATGSYAPGELIRSSQAPDLAVSGQLWWSESNWRNRIAVPLSFAPVSNACSQTSSAAPVSVYGSELMNEATSQWAPTFCLDPKLFKFTHVQTAEPLAQRLLADPSSGVNAAFASTPPDGGFSVPTVQAPVAATGFSISYNIDDNNGQPVTKLKLTPRLLAKLMTESYPGDNFDRFQTGQFGNRNPDGTAGSGIHDNPVNITDDPEFRALNPGISAEDGLPGPATLILPSGESDVTQALTAYINADPEARAWLNGKPDPWGMVVNHNYVGIQLPLLRWPLLDTTLPDFANQVACTTADPSPWLPLLASPTPALATATIDVQFASSPGRNACTLTGDPNDPSNHLYQWTSTGRMQPGLRFVIGVTSLGEVNRYDLQSAELQSSAANTDPTAQFTNSAGRTFVGADIASLAAAAKYLVADPTGKTWSLDPADLQGHSDAYPGFMLVNADVPTTGLSGDLANDYANLLRFAAGRGQQVGDGNGDLPPGYLPLTSANHLGDEAAYTRLAADNVRAQSGVVPELDGPTATTPGTSSAGPHGATGGTAGGSNSGGGAPAGNGAAPAGTTATAPGTSSRVSTSPSSVSNAPAQRAVGQTVTTPATHLGLASVLLPGILGVALLAGLLAGGLTWRPRGRT